METLKALLIIWHMDPTGAGTVLVTPLESITQCYEVVGRGRLSGSLTSRAACLTADKADAVAATLADNRCTVRDGDEYTCRGRE